MAAISVTATAVKKVTSGSHPTRTANGKAGATVTAGQPLCKNTTGGLEPADANGASAYLKTCVGIALNGGAVDQPIEYATEGDVTFNAVLTAGTGYIVGATPGDINPDADRASGWTVIDLGRATSTTNMRLKIFNSGAAVA